MKLIIPSRIKPVPVPTPIPTRALDNLPALKIVYWQNVRYQGFEPRFVPPEDSRKIPSENAQTASLNLWCGIRSLNQFCYHNYRNYNYILFFRESCIFIWGLDRGIGE